MIELYQPGWGRYSSKIPSTRKQAEYSYCAPAVPLIKCDKTTNKARKLLKQTKNSFAMNRRHRKTKTKINFDKKNGSYESITVDLEKGAKLLKVILTRMVWPSGSL